MRCGQLMTSATTISDLLLFIFCTISIVLCCFQTTAFQVKALSCPQVKPASLDLLDEASHHLWTLNTALTCLYILAVQRSVCLLQWEELVLKLHQHSCQITKFIENMMEYESLRWGSEVNKIGKLWFIYSKNGFNSVGFAWGQWKQPSLKYSGLKGVKDDGYCPKIGNSNSTL